MFDQGLLPGFEPPPVPTHGLFFTVLPDAAAQARISELAGALRSDHQLRGKPLAQERLHVTLYFLGNHIGLPEGLIAKAQQAAAAVSMPTFEVGFDRIASFAGSSSLPRNAPLVLLTDGAADALKDFQRALSRALKRAGLPSAAPDRFTPHVTLLYDNHRIAEQPVAPPVAWTINEFVLIASVLGKTQHLPLARWPLTSR